MKRIIIVQVPVVVNSPKSVFAKHCTDMAAEIKLDRDIWEREGHTTFKTVGKNTWRPK